ncbi:MAG: hypothetical protein ACC682_16355, partial [Gemmatimonadota bacterium]
MSEFEFVAVLISMVIGLGITHLLRGIAQAVHERQETPLDTVHMAWTANVFLQMVLNWWVMFSWHTYDTWSFATFLLLILWAVSLYLLVVFLYPPRKPASEGWAALYDGNRQWFLSTFATFMVLDIWITGIRGGLFDPPTYLPFVGHYLILTVIGIVVRRRGYHTFLAWYILST